MNLYNIIAFLMLSITLILNIVIKLYDSPWILILSVIIIFLLSFLLFGIQNLWPIRFCGLTKRLFPQILMNNIREKIIITGSPDGKEAENARVWLNQRIDYIDPSWLQLWLKEWGPETISLKISYVMADILKRKFIEDFLVLYKNESGSKYEIFISEKLYLLGSPNQRTSGDSMDWLNHQKDGLEIYLIISVLRDLVVGNAINKIINYTGEFFRENQIKTKEDKDKSVGFLLEITEKGTRECNEIAKEVSFIINSILGEDPSDDELRELVTSNLKSFNHLFIKNAVSTIDNNYEILKFEEINNDLLSTCYKIEKYINELCDIKKDIENLIKISEEMENEKLRKKARPYLGATHEI